MLISIPVVGIIMQSLDLKQDWRLFYQEYSLPLHKELINDKFLERKTSCILFTHGCAACLVGWKLQQLQVYTR